jgi:hypothetical protein
MTAPDIVDISCLPAIVEVRSTRTYISALTGSIRETGPVSWWTTG